ncbi:MAG: radical SAM family heme chaperone HemW [Chitinophagaceae bacterium]|nr:radical SAM family heme chaperone HemW [Chitinophagaceae bacterium]
MAGIYFHIPYCKKKCHYCNFHFSTSLETKNEVYSALLKELDLRKEFLGDQKVETIYFGGGTPSLFETHELDALLEKCHQQFEVSADAEITLEANPDDMSREKIKSLQQIGINRLSIGIQSFFEEDLIYMNRSHSALQAESCIQTAQDAGIDNLSIDLIFGFPQLTDEKWKHNLDNALSKGVPHLSCYAMTVEPRTALSSMIDKGKTQPVSSEQVAGQYEYLMERLSEAGFEHYEISSFAKPGYRAVHNSNYWKGVHYLGIGPSAHSFNGNSRQWNVANNILYARSISNNECPLEMEILTPSQQLNERIMIGLRTSDGINLLSIQNSISPKEWTIFSARLESYQKEGFCAIEKGSIKLTRKGKLFADQIASDLFLDSAEEDE